MTTGPVPADLDHVLNRLLQVLWPEEASAWLAAPIPHLGGRPLASRPWGAPTS